jgi:hypothetical protein
LPNFGKEKKAMGEVTSILETAFDTPNEKGSTEPIPAGTYVASVFNAEVKAFKSGKGQGVNLTWEINDNGDYNGRRIFDLIPLSHENADTMRIGRGKFKDVAAACGVTEAITDLSVICHKPCLVTVKIETDDSGQYPDKNRISRVKPISKAKVVKLAATGTDGGKPFDDDVDF